MLFYTHYVPCPFDFFTQCTVKLIIELEKKVQSMDCLAQTVDSGRSTLCARQSMDGPDPQFAQNMYIDR